MPWPQRPAVRRRLSALLLLLLLLSLVRPAPATAQPVDDAVPGELLVRFRPGTSAAAASDAHRRNGGRLLKALPRLETHVVEVSRGNEAALQALYRRHPNVLSVERNGRYHATVLGPNDPDVGLQWQYNNTGQGSPPGTPGADIRAFEAWQVTMGSPAVTIAILDTGIDQDHPDLQSKIAGNVNFTTSPTVDDLDGHGTHVAGIAGAATNNGVGVAGTCPNCRLLNVKVLDDTRSGAWSWVANGITYAADNGAQVINLSLGGPAGSETVRAAIDYAWSKGVVVVAAAGNNGSSTLFYPAAYDNTIAVAMTDRNDLRYPSSNFGASWVDVAAPGAAIYSTAPNHPSNIWGAVPANYGTLYGTSQAAPHVAGVAGLVWSTAVCAARDNACVRARIENSADWIAGTGTLWAKGRVNAFRAVDATTPLPPTPTPTATATPTSTPTVTATFTPTNTPTLTGTPTATPTSTPTPTFTGTPTVTATATPTVALDSLGCPCSLWGALAPALSGEGDGTAIEVGVKFRASAAGRVTGVRFYKGALNAGTHVGNLWTSTGTLLGSAIFTNETALGWQQVTFAAPVALQANTTYVASYHAPAGHYAFTGSYFGTGLTSGPLTALADGADGGNGVFRLSGTSTFPTDSFQAGNYWVDVVFGAPPPTATPTATPTASATATATPTATATATATGTPTATPTSTPTATATATPTDTATSTPTGTPTATATSTPTATATSTETPTSTPTATPTSTPTATPTSTPTATPSETPTPTATPTDTATSTPTDTPTATATPTASFTPTPTATETPTPTPTATATQTPTSSPTASPAPPPPPP
ncbi:MAG TPA: S8 family serine peptidase, partial [Chloroflexota bacterium]|nr:S8 family serine peptidase [Chloroflexota bacterium]